MPRTASNSQTRKSIHSRLRPQPAPSERDKTPVLLRLPKIEIAEEPTASVDESIADPMDATGTEPRNYAIPEEAADFPEYGDLPGVPHHEVPSEENEPDETREEMDSTDSAIGVVNTAASADLEPKTIVAAAPEHNVETTQVDAMAHVHPDDEQSWWEHWSSGVVLIILIIALVTASILAFNDTPDSDPNLLAENGTSESSSPDLDEISIPDLVDSSSTESVTAQEAVAIPALTGEDATVESDGALSVPSIGAQLVGSTSPSTEQNSTSTDTNGTAADDSESLLLGDPEGMSLQFTNDPQLPTPGTGNQSGSATEPAQRSEESGLQLTPPPLAAPSMNKTAGGPELPSLGGDLAAPVAEPPSMLFGQETAGQTANTNTSAPPLPTLPTMQVSTGDSTPAFNQASHLVSKPTETVTPTTPTETAPSTGSASTGQSNATSPSEASSKTGLPDTTLTPDSDAEAIMQAYREFKKITYGSNLYNPGN